MSKSVKLNLILTLFVVLGTISFFGSSTISVQAVCRSFQPPRCPSGSTIIPGTIGADGCMGPGACSVVKVGGDADVHGCIASAGYSWCEIKNKCLRTWEEACTPVRTASGYAWSDNVGYISFSGSIAASESSCTPDSPLTQTLSCPSGQTGSITQTRTSTCPSGASSPTTSSWTTTSNTCITPIACGNNLKEGSEICDGIALNGQTCATQLGSGYTGSLSCNSSCSGFVTSSCVAPAIVPGTPTSVSAVAGNSKATINFTAPSSNGGAVITGYTVTSNPGNITASGSASPIMITGLSNGTTYTFTVKATNVVGTGPASSPSNSIKLDLEWYGSDTPAGMTTWYVAIAACSNLSTAGGLNPGVTWRLPHEFELIEKWNSVSRPTRATLTPGFQNGEYWTNDTNSNATSYAWWVDMGNYMGGTYNNSSKDWNGIYSRCVR